MSAPTIHPALARHPLKPATATVRAALGPKEMERARRIVAEQWPKKCACGEEYEPTIEVAVRTKRGVWGYLARRYQRTDAYSTNEARDCACGSTLEIILAVHDPEAA